MNRYRPIVFHILFSTLPKSIKLRRWLCVRDQCLKLIWTIIVRCLAAAQNFNENENEKFVFDSKKKTNVFPDRNDRFCFQDLRLLFTVGYNIHQSVKLYFNVQCRRITKLCKSIRFRWNSIRFLFFFVFSSSDSKTRTIYQSCLQNALSIISSLINHQVEHSKQNLQTTTNPFASKVLIKVCLDFLLQNTNEIKAPICLRCLTSLAKVKLFKSFWFDLSFFKRVFR